MNQISQPPSTKNIKNAWWHWVYETKLGHNWLFFHRQFLDQIVQIWQHQALLNPPSFEKAQPYFFYLNPILNDIIWGPSNPSKNHSLKKGNHLDEKNQYWVSQNIWRAYLQTPPSSFSGNLDDSSNLGGSSDSSDSGVNDHLVNTLEQLKDHQNDILCIPQLLHEKNFKQVLALAWQKLAVDGLLCIEQFNPFSLQYFLGKRCGLWHLLGKNNDLGIASISPNLLQNFAYQQGWALVYAKYHIYSFDILMQQKKLNTDFELAFDSKNAHTIKNSYTESIGQRWFARFGLCYYLVLQKKGISEPATHLNFEFKKTKAGELVSCPRKSSEH